MSAWQMLEAELGHWRSASRRATFWCRDDDASRDSLPLERLLEIADRAALPIALAAIPAALERSLVGALAGSQFVIVVQHGYAHRNHAPPEERKMELGLHRDAEETIAELVRGADILRDAFDRRFAAVLVPPWNRIAAPIVARLPEAGFSGLSTLGPRKERSAAAGLVQCNTHVDLVAWRRDRTFVGVEAALDRVVAHLRARREGAEDAGEATGVLTHHIDMSEPGWEFVVELVARTREQGAVWIDARSAFGMREGAAPISGRSA
jgi:hypothetical protein